MRNEGIAMSPVSYSFSKSRNTPICFCSTTFSISDHDGDDDVMTMIWSGLAQAHVILEQPHQLSTIASPRNEI